jgi:hypothetical protein
LAAGAGVSSAALGFSDAVAAFGVFVAAAFGAAALFGLAPSDFFVLALVVVLVGIERGSSGRVHGS